MWCATIMMLSTSQSLEFDLSLNLLLSVPTRLKKPAKPVRWVWVWGGYLKHDPYLYLAYPHPHTHMGLQTHDMHYALPACLDFLDAVVFTMRIDLLGIFHIDWTQCMWQLIA